ncbi:MAG: hypothetical protein AB1724_13490 [Thermodesulfobacteriota bacterium]
MRSDDCVALKKSENNSITPATPSLSSSDALPDQFNQEIGSEQKEFLVSPDKPLDKLSRGSDASKKQKTPTTVYLVLAKNVSLDDIGGLISLGVLLWPLLFFPIARRVAKSRWKRKIMNFLEVFLIGFSFYCFYGVFQLYKPTLWGYLLTALFVLYSFVSFAELLISSLKKKAVKI